MTTFTTLNKDKLIFEEDVEILKVMAHPNSDFIIPKKFSITALS